MTTTIRLDKSVRRQCTDTEVTYLMNSISEMVKDKQSLFLPWPVTKEEIEKGNGTEITFLPINPGKLDRMVMIIPLFIKDENLNVWYVRMKGDLQLDIRSNLTEGHYRTRKKPC